MACSTTAISGRLGKAVVDDALVLRLTQWSINPTAGESAWADSDSAGYTNRKTARLDCTGSIEGKFDTGTPVYTQFVAGDAVQLVLWQDATLYWAFPCVIITGFNFSFNQDSQEVVGWSADFGADGIFYRPGQVGAPSETLPT